MVGGDNLYSSFGERFGSDIFLKVCLICWIMVVLLTHGFCR